MTEKDSITAKIVLEKDDIVSLMFYAFRKRITFKILIILLPLTLVIMLSTYLKSPEPMPFSMIGLLVLVVILAASMPLMLYFTAGREYDSNERLKEEQIYTLDKENIHIKGETFESQLTWDKVYKLTESKSYFYIWQSKNSANIIPKRCLNEEDIKFLELMKKTV